MRFSLLFSFLVLIVEKCISFQHWRPVITRRALRGIVTAQDAEGRIVKSSHTELVTYLEKQASSGVTEFCNVVGYKQSPVPLVNLKVNELWDLRGSAELRRPLNKEDIPLLCTFGPRGQGKTEFCRHLVLNHTLFTSCMGIDVILPITVSFFGSDGYNAKSIDRDIEMGFAFRALKSCGLPSSNVKTISELCDTLRGTGGREVMILFIVDELLNVPEEPLKELLDTLTNIQHYHLERGFATFTVVTSLSVKPVKDVIVTEFGRYLSPLLLPVPQKNDLTDIADSLYQYFASISTLGEARDSHLRDERNLKDCQRLINAVVSISGLHFGTLDFASRRLYCKVISPQKHRLIEAVGLPTLAHGDQSAEGFSRWSSVIVRDLFLDETSDESGVDFASAMSLFQWTILHPNELVSETKFRDLLSAGVVYEKERVSNDTLEMVVPDAQ